MTIHASTDSLADGRSASSVTPSSTNERARSRWAGASRASWIGVGVVWVAAVLVFWVFDALPFMDLPAHAGLIALRHRFESSPFEQQYFVLASNLGPYSLFRFLGEGFNLILGPLGAVRALATLPVLATPAALWFARRKLHGDSSPTTLFYGIALSFGLMTILGFASYLLGLAVLLFVLTLWLEVLPLADAGERTTRKEVALAFAMALLFVAHGHAFLLGVGLIFVTALAGAKGTARSRLLRMRAIAPALVISAYAAWISRQGSIPAGSAALPATELTPVYEGIFAKLGLLLTATLTTRTGLDVLAACVIWFLVGTAAIRTARALERATHVDPRSRTHSRALLWAFASVVVVFVALPHSIGWFGFADGRLVPLLLFLLLMSVQRPLLGNLEVAFDRGAPAAATLLVALTLGGSYRFQDEARGFREVLARVPAHARVLNLPIDPNSDVFTAHPFIHYDKLVLTERPIVVSDVWFHQGTALFPTPKNPALRLPPSYSESNLVRVDWPAYHFGDWDYVLIRTRPEGSPGPTPELLELDAHEGGWWLYRVNGSSSGR